MKLKLQNIADVQFGSAISSSTQGKLPCLQVSNITIDGFLDVKHLFYAKDEFSSYWSRLDTGDIILPAKGQKFSSALIPTELGSRVTVSSSLFVIKLTEESVLPEYLHWYLNLSRTKWKLKTAATGTNIPSLSIKDLRDSLIEVPDTETQNKIINLKRLQEKELKTMYQLGNARMKLTEAVTKKLVE